MKKQIKKLALKRETLRQLSGRQLSGVGGGLLFELLRDFTQGTCPSVDPGNPASIDGNCEP